jgi:hypothetical protein
MVVVKLHRCQLAALVAPSAVHYKKRLATALATETVPLAPCRIESLQIAAVAALALRAGQEKREEALRAWQEKREEVPPQNRKWWRTRGRTRHLRGLPPRR